MGGGGSWSYELCLREVWLKATFYVLHEIDYCTALYVRVLDVCAAVEF